MGKFNLSHWAIRHPQLIAFLILAIGLGGAFAYQRLGRAEDPAFTIKVAVISAVWPGATSEEMQDQVADRIEKKLQELPWVDKIDTYSKPGFSAITFSFRDATPPREVPMLFLQLRKKMSDLRADLPGDVVGPTVNDEFGDVNSVLYTIVGDGASYAQLKEVAEALRKRLQRVPDVTKVDLYGDQAERIFVEFELRQARHARRAAASDVRIRSPSRTRWRRPANFRPTPSACPAGHRRVARRRGGGGDAGLRQRPDFPPRRHRRRFARLRRPALLSRSRPGPAGGRNRRRHAEGRQYSRARQERSTRRSPNSRPTCRAAS